MIPCDKFYNFLQLNDLEFFTGVPDSTLKNLCACIAENSKKENHVVAANEGNAIGVATGYHLATGKIPVVYMQNSGLGNTVNPLTSLASKDVYSIPILLLIGWRGEPGVKDEPQHAEMGVIQNSMLETLNIPYEVLPEDFEQSKESVLKALNYLRHNNSSCALIIKKNTFEKYDFNSAPENDLSLLREEALEVILENTEISDILVSTTGKTSRELFELRERRREGHEKDFLTVGSMGLISPGYTEPVGIWDSHRKDF